MSKIGVYYWAGVAIILASYIHVLMGWNISVVVYGILLDTTFTIVIGWWLAVYASFLRKKEKTERKELIDNFLNDTQ